LTKIVSFETIELGHQEDSWVELTFILLARPDQMPASTHPLLSPEEIKTCRMVGDVNMFLSEGVEGEAECEIMIAGRFTLDTADAIAKSQKSKTGGKDSLAKPSSSCKLLSCPAKV
jgi:hypothetical protein